MNDNMLDKNGIVYCRYVLNQIIRLQYAISIIPNLKSNGKSQLKQKKYPIFYGDIDSLEQEEYQSLMEKGTDKDFNDELVMENWHNSRICLKKMKRYRIGVLLSIGAIVLAFISFAAHILMYQ